MLRYLKTAEIYLEEAKDWANKLIRRFDIHSWMGPYRI